MAVQDAILFYILAAFDPAIGRTTRSSEAQSEGMHADSGAHYGPFYRNDEDEAEVPVMPLWTHTGTEESG